MLRRSFLFGLSAAVAMPLVAQAGNLMSLRGVKLTRWIDVPKWCPPGFIPYDDVTLTKQQFPELHAWLKKCRSMGAHLSDDFKLTGGPMHEWYGPYDHYSQHNRLQKSYKGDDYVETVEVPLISVETLARANSSLVKPGMVVSYPLNAEVLKAHPGPARSSSDRPVGFNPWSQELTLVTTYPMISADSPAAVMGATQGEGTASVNRVGEGT